MRLLVLLAASVAADVLDSALNGPASGLEELFSYEVEGEQNSSAPEKQVAKGRKESGRVSVKHSGCVDSESGRAPLCKAVVAFTEVPTGWQCDSQSQCVADPTMQDHWERSDTTWWPLTVEYRPGEGIQAFRSRPCKARRGNQDLFQSEGLCNVTLGYKQGIAAALFGLPSAPPRGTRRGQSFAFSTDVPNIMAASRGVDVAPRVHGVGYVDSVGHGKVRITQKYQTPPREEQWKDHEYRCPLALDKTPHVQGHHAVTLEHDGSTHSAEQEVALSAIGDAETAAREQEPQAEGKMAPPPAFHTHYKVVLKRVKKGSGGIWSRRAKTMSAGDEIVVPTLNADDRGADSVPNHKLFPGSPHNRDALHTALQCAVDRTGDIPAGHHLPQSALKDKMDSECLTAICDAVHASADEAVASLEEYIEDALADEPVVERKLWAGLYGLSSCLTSGEAQRAIIRIFGRDSVWGEFSKTRSRVLFAIMTTRPPADEVLDFIVKRTEHGEFGNEEVWLTAAGVCGAATKSEVCERFAEKLERKITTAEKIISENRMTGTAVQAFQNVGLSLAFLGNLGGCTRFLKTAKTYSAESYPPPVRVLGVKAMRRMPCKEAEDALIDMARPNPGYLNHSKVQSQVLKELQQRRLTPQALAGLRVAFTEQEQLEKDGWNPDGRLINTHQNALHRMAKVATAYPRSKHARHVARMWALQEQEDDWGEVHVRPGEFSHSEAARLLESIRQAAGPGFVRVHGGIHHGAQHTLDRYDGYANGAEREYDCRSDDAGGLAELPVGTAIRGGLPLVGVIGNENAFACTDASFNGTLFMGHGASKEEATANNDVGKFAAALDGTVEIVFTEHGRGEGVIKVKPAFEKRRHVAARVVTLEKGDVVTWGHGLTASLLLGGCDAGAALFVGNFATSESVDDDRKSVEFPEGHACEFPRCTKMWKDAASHERSAGWGGWAAAGRNIASACGAGGAGGAGLRRDEIHDQTAH